MKSVSRMPGCRSRPGPTGGYTLIELMLIIAVISILLVMAIPLYQQYATRARVAEGLSLATSVKSAVSESYLSEGTFPADNTEAGLALPAGFETNDVETVEVSNSPEPGSITITYKNSEFPDLGGNNVLIMVPVTYGGSINWECNQGTVPNWARPKRCR